MMSYGGAVAAIKDEGGVEGILVCFVPPPPLCTCVYTNMAAAAWDVPVLAMI